MNLSERMIGRARQAAAMLGERATNETASYLAGCMCDDGGFSNRAGRSDLYYTAFALDSMQAVGAAVRADRVEAYLRGFGDGEGLDFVHLVCLSRCWASLGGGRLDESVRKTLLVRLANHRSADGGFHPQPGRQTGSAYACFLAVIAHQGLAAEIPDSAGLARCIETLRCEGGGFANESNFVLAATPTTAAAVAVLTELGQPVPSNTAEWLLARYTDSGGFEPVAGAPSADLLSTATALYALWAMGAAIEGLRDRCSAFVAQLCDGGKYRPNLREPLGDCEYTWYALLATGTLAGQDAAETAQP